MSLITCPDCKREISDSAKSCIHCGRPMTAIEAAPQMPPVLEQRQFLPLSDRAITNPAGSNKIKIYASSFGEGAMGFDKDGFVYLDVSKFSLFPKTIKIPASMLESVERTSSGIESKKSLGGTLAGGLVGGVLLGGVGAVAGALASGNKKEIIFSAVFKDNNVMHATADIATYAKIEEAARISARLPMTTISKNETTPEKKPSKAMTIIGILLIFVSFASFSSSEEGSMGMAILSLMLGIFLIGWPRRQKRKKE